MTHDPQPVEFVLSFREEGVDETIASQHALLLSDASAGAVMTWARATIDHHNQTQLTRRTLVGVQIVQPHRRTGT